MSITCKLFFFSMCMLLRELETHFLRLYWLLYIPIFISSWCVFYLNLCLFLEIDPVIHMSTAVEIEIDLYSYVHSIACQNNLYEVLGWMVFWRGCFLLFSLSCFCFWFRMSGENTSMTEAVTWRIFRLLLSIVTRWYLNRSFMS